MHLTFALFFSSFFLLLFFCPQFSSSIVVYEGKVTNSVKEHRERKEGNASLEISQIPNSYHSFIFPSCLRYYQKKKKEKEERRGKHGTLRLFLRWWAWVTESTGGGEEGVGFTSTIVFDVVLLLRNFEQLSCQHDRCLAAIFGCSKAKWKNQQKKKTTRTTTTTTVPLPYSSSLSTFFSLSNNSVAAALFLRLTLK